MDRFFDRLGDLLHSLLEGDSSTTGYYDPKDPDMQAAIEELDEYLKNGGISEEPAGGFYRQRKESPKRQAQDTGLRRDYATLEVAFAGYPNYYDFKFEDSSNNTIAMSNEAYLPGRDTFNGNFEN